MIPIQINWTYGVISLDSSVTNKQNSIANDELYRNPQIDHELSDGQQ